MPEGQSNVGVFGRIESRLDRIEDKLDARLSAIEDKLDTRMTTLDRKVDGLATRQDRLEGRLDGMVAVVKWLGPVGIAAIIFGLLVLYGFLPIGPVL